MLSFDNEKIRKNKHLQKLKAVLFELKQIKKQFNDCMEIGKYYQDWIVVDGLLSLNDVIDIVQSNRILVKLEKILADLKMHVSNDCNVCKLNRMTTAHKHVQISI